MTNRPTSSVASSSLAGWGGGFLVAGGALIRLGVTLALTLMLALAAGWLALRARAAAQPPPAAVADHAALGINVALEQYAPEDLARVLDRLQAAQVTWLRQRFPWDAIEPARGQFVWDPWDAIIEETAAHGLRLIAVLDRSPAWARPSEDADTPWAPPQERADFGRFVAAFAGRYAGRIAAYQIWDEPNIAPHWGARPIDPGAYLGLLREGFYQARAADPRAVVLLAALAPNDEPGGANLGDLAFLDQVYTLGGRAWFDAVAAQPYGVADAPDPANPRGWGRAASLRAVMERHGDSATPLWITAFGWNALPPGWSGASSPWGQVAESTQAAYVRSAVAHAKREWPWLGPLIWAELQPNAPADDPRHGFALWEADGSPRPAWDALVEMATAPAVLGVGVHTPDHPALRYRGGWRVTAAAADIGQSGDRLEIPFWGRGLALQVRRGPYWAYLNVTVDGRPAPTLPRDPDGRAYLVLYAAEPRAEIVDLAPALSPGEHTAVIEATGGWGQWALERVIVRGDALPARPWLPGALAVLALLPAAGAWRALQRGEGARAFAVLVALVDQLDRQAARVPASVQTTLAVGLGLLVAGAPSGLVRLAALLALAVVLWFRLDLLPALIPLYLPFYLHPLSLLGRPFSAPELGVALGTAILATRWVLAWGARRTPWRVACAGDGPVAALAALAILATLAAAEREVALRELRVVIIEPALFYLLVTRGAAAVGRPSRVWPTLDGFVIGAVLASLLGLSQLVTRADLIEAEGVWRVRALYGSPNNLALYLDRALPVILAIALWGGGWRRWLYGVAVLPVAAACFLTFSKGAWFLGIPIAIVTLALIGIWQARREGRPWRRAALVTLAALAVMALALVPFLGTERFARLADFSSGTGFFRLRLWQSAWQMALDHPWLGVGPDNFLYQYRSRYVLPDAWGELNLSHPHNIVLDLWTRLGIGGVVVGAWLLIVVARLAWRALQRQGTVSPVAAGLLASAAAAAAHGLIDNSLFLVDLGFVWMMTLGALAVQAEAEQGDG